MSVARGEVEREAGYRFTARTIRFAMAMVPVTVRELVAENAERGCVLEQERYGAIRTQIGGRGRALADGMDRRPTPGAKEIVSTARARPLWEASGVQKPESVFGFVLERPLNRPHGAHMVNGRKDLCVHHVLPGRRTRRLEDAPRMRRRPSVGLP